MTFAYSLDLYENVLLYLVIMQPLFLKQGTCRSDFGELV